MQPATETTPDLLARHLPAHPAGLWAEAARQAARQRLSAMGLPGRRDEYWRFTNPSDLTAVPAPEAAVFDSGGESTVFGETDRLKLIFVDGVFRPDLSDDLALDGVEISLLDTAMAADIHWARELYGVLEEAGQDPVPRPLAALNTACASTGCVIRVSKTPPRPISFRYVHEDPTSDAIIHHVVRVEQGASLTVLESGPAAARFNKCMEVDIADGAALHHVRAQGRDHERRAATHTFARLGAESAFKSFTLTVNGVLTRNETVVEFTGDDAIAHVAGASVGDGDFHHDDTVFVTHDGERCESRQVFKKVLRNGAVGVFQGKILVRPGAQKTDGYQISQGLLLDERSQFLAKPELEIYADDVACSHGSTSGALDETGLFYLLSRGISRADAEAMLILAFLDEAIAEIEDEALADDMRSRVAGWLERRRR
ncbi:MAG: Fe-S cluster assembly protein SufD [Pseudomonadota bacterium]